MLRNMQNGYREDIMLHAKPIVQDKFWIVEKNGEKVGTLRRDKDFVLTVKSQSFYCAGYYIINFETGWMKAYCPKLITLTRNQFEGPYKTKFEIQEQLRLAHPRAGRNEKT